MVRVFEPPNQFGINVVTFSISQDIRKNGRSVENNGLTPDINYEFTAKDLQDNYQDYKARINQAVTSLL